MNITTGFNIGDQVRWIGNDDIQRNGPIERIMIRVNKEEDYIITYEIRIESDKDNYLITVVEADNLYLIHEKQTEGEG